MINKVDIFKETLESIIKGECDKKNKISFLSEKDNRNLKFTVRIF